MSPQRIQLRRTAGWRKPEGAIVVARPTRYGNPFRVGDPHPVFGWPMSAGETVQLYRGALAPHRLLIRAADGWKDLRGQDLACWCPLSSPCHADVLLELANVSGVSA
jgi:hypothetical protein